MHATILPSDDGLVFMMWECVNVANIVHKMIVKRADVL